MTNKPVKQQTIKQLLSSDRMQEQIARALPKHCKPDRMIRVALTSLLRTPKLNQVDVNSFAKAMLDLSQLGLEPDGRRVHLLPFNNNKTQTVELQVIIDYKGLVELVRRSGEVLSIHASVVYENDGFEWRQGTEPDIKHNISLTEDRGKPIAAYAVVKLKDGALQFEVMTYKQIEDIRKRSKAKNSGPWVTDWDEMAKKTVFRRLSKWLPMNDALDQAQVIDDQQFEHQYPIKNITPQRPQLFGGSKENIDDQPRRVDESSNENTSLGNNAAGDTEQTADQPESKGVIRRHLAMKSWKESDFIAFIKEQQHLKDHDGEVNSIDDLPDGLAKNYAEFWDSISAGMEQFLSKGQANE